MIKVMRNRERTHSGCPVLRDTEVLAYLKNGELPASAEFLDVPPGKVIRQRGVWLHPKTRMHYSMTMFLLSTDVYAMNVDSFEEDRDQVYCYYSPEAETCYLGRIEELADGRRMLCALLDGLHLPLNINEGLQYVGRVISAL